MPTGPQVRVIFFVCCLIWICALLMTEIELSHSRMGTIKVAVRSLEKAATRHGLDIPALLKTLTEMANDDVLMDAAIVECLKTLLANDQERDALRGISQSTLAGFRGDICLSVNQVRRTFSLSLSLSLSLSPSAPAWESLASNSHFLGDRLSRSSRRAC